MSVAQIDHDPVADELLAAGWRRDVRDGWWRSPGSRAMPAVDALRCARRDRERAAGDCHHFDLAVHPDTLTTVEGAWIVTCRACGWARTATPDPSLAAGSSPASPGAPGDGSVIPTKGR